jgi:hypothetical protein
MRTQPGRAHVASMPDTTWPISGHPPGSSRDRIHTPVLMSAVPISTLHRQRRTSSRPLPDASKCAFSQLAHHDRLQLTQQWVVWNRPPQGGSGGPTSIVRTAPGHEALPTSSSLPVRDTRNRRRNPGSPPRRQRSTPRPRLAARSCPPARRSPTGAYARPVSGCRRVCSA